MRVLREQAGLHARLARRRGVRQLPDRGSTSRFRALIKAWDDAAGGRSAKGEDSPTRSRCCKTWDQRWAVDSVADVARRFLGRGRVAQRRSRPTCRDGGRRSDDHRPERRPSSCLQSLVSGVGQARRRFRHVEDAVGRDQSLPAPDRRHRPAIRRRRAEHSGRRSRRRAWGSLASFGARPYPGTKKWYGTSGNSFVAVVEFGPKVRAKAVTAGGESGHPGSKHFNDQATRYATGNLREYIFIRTTKGPYRANVQTRTIRHAVCR